MRFRIACYQFSPTKGDKEANLDRVAGAIRKAAEEQVELLAFPETCTTGYFLEGGVAEQADTQHELAASLERRLAGKLSKPVDAVVGFYEKEGGQLYNSAAYLESTPTGVSVRACYRKFFLPTYGVFDEARFVAPGNSLGLVRSRLGTVGLLICEDLWHSLLGDLLALQGASILVVPSASPARGFSNPEVGNLSHYKRMLGGICGEHGVFGMNPQLCGFEGGKGFVGQSFIVGPLGDVIACSESWDEAMVISEYDSEIVAVCQTNLPLLRDLRARWRELQSIISQIPEA
ncbi:MAG: carbon-nitrogen hydrolase family protein [Fimbriimonadaceae bacterium]